MVLEISKELTIAPNYPKFWRDNDVKSVNDG